jgi:arginase
VKIAMTQKKIALLGTPVEKGAGKLGCSMGSVALRIAGIVEALQELGLYVHDYEDIHFGEEQDIKLAGNAKFAPYITGWTRALEQRSYELLADGAVPVFMGGDHSLSMGSVSGAARYAAEQGRDLHVIWVDAHTDFNTPLTSPSGNMHGMPVAFFCGEKGFEGILPEDRAIVNPTNVHMVGIRSVDADEKALISSKGVNIYDMRTVDEKRIVPIMSEIIEKVKASNAMLHVSFDADAVDPIYAPGVGTPVNGGLTYREAHLILEMLHDSGLVTSFDIVELNPYLDVSGKTARLLVGLVASLFGKSTI